MTSDSLFFLGDDWTVVRMKLDAICARLKDTLSKGHDKVTDETNNNNLVKEDEDSGRTDSPQPDGTNRRKRRKNVKPRFFVQPPADESNLDDEDDGVDNNGVLDLSSSKDDPESLSAKDYDNNEVIDLSIAHKGRDVDESSKPDDTSPKADDGVAQTTPGGHLPPAPGGDAMKTYAESTMKELLSMYGFDNDEEARSSFPPPSRPITVLEEEDDEVSRASSLDSMDSSSVSQG